MSVDHGHSLWAPRWHDRQVADSQNESLNVLASYLIHAVSYEFSCLMMRHGTDEQSGDACSRRLRGAYGVLAHETPIVPPALMKVDGSRLIVCGGGKRPWRYLDGNSFGRAGAHPYRRVLMAEGHVRGRG